MAQTNSHNSEKGNVWFLNSDFSNHMCGTKGRFFELDETFKESVKLGDNRRPEVKGNGSVRLRIEGRIQVISEVYYIPKLKDSYVEHWSAATKGIESYIRRQQV